MKSQAIQAEKIFTLPANNREFAIFCRQQEKKLPYHAPEHQTPKGIGMAENTVQEKPARPAISRPVFERTIKVNSEQAIRVIRKSYDRLIKSLYAIDVILRIIGEERAIDELEGLVSNMIGECAQQLQAAKTRLDKITADNGITETPVYTNPTDFKAQIASPQIAQFIELIKLLDQLMIVMDTLWLCQIVSSKQCVDARYQWQQRLQRLANRIVTIERIAHRAAYDQGRGEEVRVAREESGLTAEPEEIQVSENQSLPDDDDVENLRV